MKRAKSTRLILITIFSSLILIVAGLWHLNSIESLLEVAKSRNVSEISKQGIRLLRYKVKSDYSLTMDLAKYIIRDDLSMPEKMSALKDQATQNGLLRIGITDLKGTSTTTDDQTLFIGDREYFQSALLGKTTISTVLGDRVDNRQGNIMVFATPIVKNGKTEGVLFLTESIENLSHLLDTSFYEGAGVSFVVDDNGLILFHYRHDLIGQNAFEGLSTEKVTQLKKSLQNDETGIVKLRVDGVESLLAFVNIPEIHNWKFIVQVSEQEVFSEVHSVTRQTIFFLLAIVAVLSMLIIYAIIFSQENETRYIKYAFEDSLTGLANYNKFCQELDKVLLSLKNQKCVVATFDIDKFKVINDNFGHTFGDQILIYLGNVLRKSLGEDDCYARMANDNFAFYIIYDDFAEVDKKIDLIYERLNSAKVSGYSEIDLFISMGLSILQEDDTEAKTIINQANMARASVKNNRNKKYAIFTKDIRDRLASDHEMEAEIKMALKKNEFLLYYQPKASIKDSRVIGAEALIRWIHPEKGFIPPSIFIPVAEKDGLIVHVGRWVVERVCQDLSSLIERGYNPFPVAINLSMAEIYQADLVERIHDTLKRYKISPNLIEVELTETVALNDNKLTTKIINEFKGIGIKVAMDDFGTGYSSLSCLQELPIDILKLDKAFIDNIYTEHNSRHIIEAMIILAHALKLEVVAEGVETKEQFDYLASIDCDIVQGYYFAKPMPLQLYEEKILLQSE